MFFFRCFRISSKIIVTKSFKRNFNDLPFDDIPEVSPASIKKVLRAQSLQFEEGYACFITCCPMCKKNAKMTLSSKIYIDKATGKFMIIEILLK